jgi:hypothetical protein
MRYKLILLGLLSVSKIALADGPPPPPPPPPAPAAVAVDDSVGVGGPGIMLGIVYNFGGNVGIQLNLMSSRRQDYGVVAAGVAYYPKSASWGLSLGGGYNMRNSTALVGWDFLNRTPQVSFGYSDTK